MTKEEEKSGHNQPDATHFATKKLKKEKIIQKEVASQKLRYSKKRGSSNTKTEPQTAIKTLLFKWLSHSGHSLLKVPKEKRVKRVWAYFERGEAPLGEMCRD